MATSAPSPGDKSDLMTTDNGGQADTGPVDQFHVSTIPLDIEPLQMKRQINFFSASSILAGVMIGSGIFVTPVNIVKACNSVGLSLVVWLVAGLLTLLVMFVYLELATMYPKAGGDYAYVRQIIGPFPAFVLAWVLLLIVNPAVFAVLSLTTAEYMMKPFFQDCPVPYWAKKIFSIWIVVSVVALNSISVKWVTRAQNVLTSAKVFALGIIIVAGGVQIYNGQTDILSTGFEGSNWSPSGISSAIYAGLFSYNGWQYIFMLIEEIKNPKKTMPLASCAGITMVTVLYLLTNIAYFTVLTPAKLIGSDAVALTFAEISLGRYAIIIPIFVACSTIGSLNGSVLGSSRIFFAAARDGLFPEILAMINVKCLTPLPAIWLMCIISLVYIVLGQAGTLLEYIGFVSALVYVVCILMLLYLRYSQPNRPRAVKIPIILPLFTLLVVTALLLVGFYQEPMKYFIGMMMIGTAVPGYLIGITWVNKPTSMIITFKMLADSAQKLCYCLPQGGVSKQEESDVELKDR